MWFQCCQYSAANSAEMGEIGWFEPSTAKALSIENSELCDSKALARFEPINSKIERACFLMTLGTSQGRATVAPISSLEYIELIVHSLSEPKVLNWVACGLWGMLMDLSGVAVQQESAELMSALVFDGGGWQ